MKIATHPCARSHRFLLLGLVLLLGWSWAQTEPVLRVVTSIHPYYDLVRQLAGERAEVTRLLPPGASPHTFDPSPRAVATVARADLIVGNGGLDPWLDDLVAASGSRAEVIELLAELVPDLHDVNPHIWLDPLLMVEAVDLLSERLAALDPAGADHYRGAAAALRDDLLALDTELRELLLPVAGAPFVPFHDAWPHFAARYGLDLVVEIEPFPGREPSPAYVAAALVQIAASGATAIFTERQLDPRPAEVVAESAGLPLFVLDPVGGDGIERYQDLLRHNAAVIADALGTGTGR